VAAKQYYETAANLGDTDAMNEVAWCYLEGFGCKKDKVSEFPLAQAVTYPDSADRIALHRSLLALAIQHNIMWNSSETPFPSSASFVGQQF
jgi:hypothetical protein